MTADELLTPRQSGKIIADNAKHIKICEEGVETCAQEIFDRIQNGKIQLLSDPSDEENSGSCNYLKKDVVHPQIANDHGVDWVFFLDALNFSFWNFSTGKHKQYLVTYKDVTYTGYLAFCAATCRTLEAGIPLTTPSYYRTITEEQLNSYLMGDDLVPCPLIKERVACLHEVANVLKEKYENTFVNCIKKCETPGDTKAQELLSLIRNDFPCFRDEGEYEVSGSSVMVSFLKRAQILISDLWSLFEGKGLGKFEDIDTLTMFADYRVPQSLQYFGAFQYSEELLDELNKTERIIEHGSIFEIEIRGCSIDAVDQITKRSRSKLVAAKSKTWKYLNDVAVDYFLWGFRREKADEMIKHPYHKVRSIYY